MSGSCVLLDHSAKVHKDLMPQRGLHVWSKIQIPAEIHLQRHYHVTAHTKNGAIFFPKHTCICEIFIQESGNIGRRSVIVYPCMFTTCTGKVRSIMIGMTMMGFVVHRSKGVTANTI